MTMRTKSSGWTPWLVGCALLLVGCNRRSGRASEGHATGAASASLEASQAAAGATQEPIQLYTAPHSAYNASIAVDNEATYVLRSGMATRLVPGTEPQDIPLERGERPVLTDHYIVYWADGAAWRIPKTGGKALRTAPIPHTPQFFVSAGDHFTWLDMPDRDSYSIQALKGTDPQIILTPVGAIDAMVMDSSRVYFVERQSPMSWRFGSIETSGGTPKVTESKIGHTPSMMALSQDIYYYEVDSMEIRRLSTDFSYEETLTKDFICSPIAVSAKIHCANREGIFELPKVRGERPMMVHRLSRPVVAMAPILNKLSWITDAGQEALAIHMLPLGGPRR